MNMRRVPGHLHCSVKNVRIMGFCSAKSMVELTCHILENATSLERLTSDAIYDNSSYGDAERSCVGEKGECNPKSRSMIMHAHKGLGVIGKYVVEKVPSTVQLSVKKLCSRCHKIKSSFALRAFSRHYPNWPYEGLFEMGVFCVAIGI
ncbi:hypothetical protein TRIUR3_09894 [Triticum urartu]|uniref:At1g61320/AtMIF1 LRR domain-containing protein n=1 Tax=Triticum urartu TaxID=4572 RepID=M8A1N3_TRIUA|nr:hypothetical protein TRIUR3_09894 [Triticum urartu]